VHEDEWSPSPLEGTTEMPNNQVLYEITDPEFLKRFGWSLSDIQNYHCTEDGC
jgi:hypothetical protein